MTRKAVTALWLVVLSVIGSSCASGATRPLPVSAADGGGEVRPDLMPETLGGLQAAEEDVSGELKKAGEKAYVSSVRLWSLREGARLRATLQVARFEPDAPTTERSFRDRVAGQVGSTAPRVRHIGDEVVYVSAGERQTFYGWFRGLYFVLLAVPTDTPNSRGLARAAMAEVQP